MCMTFVLVVVLMALAAVHQAKRVRAWTKCMLMCMQVEDANNEKGSEMDSSPCRPKWVFLHGIRAGYVFPRSCGLTPRQIRFRDAARSDVDPNNDSDNALDAKRDNILYEEQNVAFMRADESASIKEEMLEKSCTMEESNAARKERDYSSVPAEDIAAEDLPEQTQDGNLETEANPESESESYVKVNPWMFTVPISEVIQLSKLVEVHVTRSRK
ncbi:hypothetical protein CDL15_Pgr026101 [Punica granatum]|uniref:Uncharacterized protein n=1 Tax=Punica granatum TaxID=22663 RepID=A0A218WDH6_PUNGR|nr:hypothetical protein CDL15_Pgr026101 [Punica granatum]